MSRRHCPRPRDPLRAAALAVVLPLALALAPPRADAPNLDPASRLPDTGSATEYWDLVARFESGHRLVARFLITNEGPGSETAAAVGHLIHPDGALTPFKNGRREGRWSLSSDGRRIEIGSSVIDWRGAVRHFEVDNDKRGVKIFLDFRTDGPGAEWPADAAPPGYAVQLLAVAEPVEGSVWVRGMPEPLAVRGRIGLTHTWMERSESDLTLRRIDFFSLQPDPAIFLSNLTTPEGKQEPWLAVRRGDELLSDSAQLTLELMEPPATEGDSEYPLPRALRLRGAAVEGEVRLGEPLVAQDPFEVLPAPFRLLLSFRSRPHRVWAESPFEVTFGPTADHPAFRATGSGIANVTFLNPLPR